MFSLMTDGAWKRKVLVDAGIAPPWECGEDENAGELVSNAWIGVSVENQDAADRRIPLLLSTPAAVRWISIEPLLGPVNFRWTLYAHEATGETYREYLERNGSISQYEALQKLDWVVVGGESGHRSRPMEMSWLETVVSQCREAGVPVFVKQDSGRFPGKQGRIPDRLWVKEYPAPLR